MRAILGTMQSQRFRGVAAALVAVLLGPLLVGAAPGNDPLLDRQYHLRRVRAPEAWDVSRGGNQVIAVLDTGVDLEHPDLRNRLVEGIDLVDRGTTPQDENGHGTFVAGVAAANLDNNRGGAGAAPRAKIMPVRVLDENGRGTSDIVAEGIRWANRAGATVINLSLADVPGQARPPTALITTDVELAIRQAALDGVVVVCAAGNNGNSTTPYAKDLPAIVVGATTRRDGVWEHSNYDDRTLFAPGVGIVSTYLEPRYAAADGTSFATPIVAAGVAMLLQQGRDAEGARQRLRNTARPVGEGHGRVDLAAALGVAPRVRSTPSPQPEPTPSPGAASERPREPEPIRQPRPVAPRPVAVKPPPPVKPAPVAPSPKPQATTKPKKVAKADRPPVKVRKNKKQRAAPVPRTAPGRTEAAAAPATPAVPAGASRPVWPIVVAGALLFLVCVSLAGWFAARRSG